MRGTILVIGGLLLTVCGCSNASLITKQQAESMAASYTIGAEELDSAASEETDPNRKAALATSSAQLTSEANLLRHGIATGEYK